MILSPSQLGSASPSRAVPARELGAFRADINVLADVGPRWAGDLEIATANCRAFEAAVAGSRAFHAQDAVGRGVRETIGN